MSFLDCLLWTVVFVVLGSAGALTVVGVVVLLSMITEAIDPYEPQAAEVPPDLAAQADPMLVAKALGFETATLFPDVPYVDSGHQPCAGECCAAELDAAFDWNRYEAELAS